MSLFTSSCRALCICVTLLLLFPAGGIGQATNQEVDLQEFARELSVYKTELESLIKNPNTSNADRITYQERLYATILQLSRIRERLSAKDGEIIDVKPGGKISAIDNKSGEKAQREVASVCDVYREYKPSGRSTYILPNPNQVSGAIRGIQAQLVETERELANVTTRCEESWTWESSLKWAAEREQLAKTLLRLEKQFLERFAPDFTPSEEKALISAGNWEQIKSLKKNVDKAWKHFVEMKKNADAIRKKYGPIPDASVYLAAQKAIYMEQAAWDEYAKLDSQYQQLRMSQSSEMKGIYDARFNRAKTELKRYHPNAVVSLHQVDDFLSSESLVLQNLIGKDGLKILNSESERRIKAMNDSR